MKYLKEGDTVILPTYQGEVVGVELPASVELEVTETEPGVQGDRVSGAKKPATLETGARRPGPAVRRDGRPRQGRHPHRRVPDAGLNAGRRSSDMARTRRDARERALSLCYELDVRGAWQLDDLLGELPVAPAPYAVELVRGVEDHARRSTPSSRKFADRWSIDRMPVIDRNLLRIAVYELGWQPEIPLGVAISEAVELAKRYSTDDSGRFVNGMLSRIAEQLRASGDPAAGDSSGG